MPEMSEIVFSSVKDAIRWSQEVALLPDIQSSMRLLYSTGGGSLNRSEAVEIAQTISLITAFCKPFKGLAIKSVYSNYRNDDRTLGIVIAHNLQKIEESNGKDVRQLIALGTGVIRNMRQVELYNGRYPFTKIARDIGISRERFRKAKSWSKLHDESVNQLCSWVDMAAIEIYGELDQRGWIA